MLTYPALQSAEKLTIRIEASLPKPRKNSDFRWHNAFSAAKCAVSSLALRPLRCVLRVFRQPVQRYRGGDRIGPGFTTRPATPIHKETRSSANGSGRSRFLLSAVCLFGSGLFTAAQIASAPQAATPSGYRIAGTVVSKTDGHPLARTRITIRDAKAPQKFQSLVTADDGKFEFHGVLPGKYSLTGAKRGFITASYDQHDQFSTAIVTGAGVETDALVLRLAPAAIIAGRILDEAGEPVRRALVTLYYDTHNSGVDQIRPFGTGQTDDQGVYEIASLVPGTYFLSASAKPWYAVHPPSDSPDSPRGKPTDSANLDRSLDVAYPLTYYPDVTEADSATPIPVRGGERLQVEIHLNPVPSLHLLFRLPNNGNKGDIFPRLEQPAFDGSTLLPADEVRTVSPGLVEMNGIPAGRYNIRFFGAGSGIQMNGVDLAKDGEEFETSGSEALSTVKVSVQVPGEAILPSGLSVSLRSGTGFAGGVNAEVDPKGEVEFDQIPAGRYEVLVGSPGTPYSVSRISAEGAEVSGHALVVTAGSPASVVLTLAAGTQSVEGTIQRAGKPFAGAMVVLVPKNPEMDRDLFRRDQSDLDGTFSLRNVVPGSYTLLAIENGWDLDWSQPAVIAAYLSHGRTVEVRNQPGRTVSLADAIDVQSR